MSTKIYNGYKLPLLSLQQLQKLLYQFRDKVQPVKNRLYAKAMACLSVDWIDRYAIGQRKIRQETVDQTFSFKGLVCPLSAAYQELRHRRLKIKSTQQRDNGADFSVEVSLIPTKNKILAMLWTERKEYIEVWKKLPGVEFYGYWNNTDPDEGISEADWRRRGKEWDKALGDGIPGLVSMNFDPIQDQFGMLRYDDVARYLPDFDHRVREHAMNAAMTDWWKKNKQKYETDGKSTRGWVSGLMDFQDWKHTPAGKKFIEVRAVLVRAKLKENLTEDDFKRELQFKIDEKGA